jgi:hypothetical protein
MNRPTLLAATLLLTGCWSTEATLSTDQSAPFATSGFTVTVVIDVPPGTEPHPSRPSSIEPATAQLSGIHGEGMPGFLTYFDTITASEPGPHTYRLPLGIDGDGEESIEIEFSTPVALGLDVSLLIPGETRRIDGDVHFLETARGGIRRYALIDADGRRLGGEGDVVVLEDPSDAGFTDLPVFDGEFSAGAPDRDGRVRVQTPAEGELAGPALVAYSVDDVDDSWSLDLHVEGGRYWVDLTEPGGNRVIVRRARDRLGSEDEGLRSIDGSPVMTVDCGVGIANPETSETHEVEYCVGELCGAFVLPGVFQESNPDCEEPTNGFIG